MPDRLRSEIGTTLEGDGFRGRILVGWLVVSTALILGATLFPFDFRRTGEGSTWSAPLRIDVDLRSGYVFENMPTNVLLFVPFGFSLATLMHLRRRASPGAVVGLTTAVGVVLSLVLESAQDAMLLRFASFGDVVSNGIGALVGASLAVWFSERALGRLRRDARRPRTVWRIGTALVVTLAAVVLTVWLDDAAAPRDWSPEYPLIIGNETSADRPWEGTLATFEIRTAPGPQIDDGPAESLASWSFVGEPTGQPALERAGSESAPPPVGGTIDADGWWRSIGPADAISDAIVASGGFEVVLEVATASLDQGGPARILSISDGTLSRNMMIGQDGADLALRVRSSLLGSDGSDPEILVPGVFEQGSLQRIVVRFVDETVHVEVDGEAPRTHSLDLGAEVAVALWSFPQSIVWMRTGDVGESLIRFTYRAVVLFPWGLALAGLMSRWGRRRTWFSAAGAVALAAGFELVLVTALDDYAFEARWVAVGAICIGGVAALFAYPPSSGTRRPSSRAPVTQV